MDEQEQRGDRRTMRCRAVAMRHKQQRRSECGDRYRLHGKRLRGRWRRGAAQDCSCQAIAKARVSNSIVSAPHAPA
jgi:hypothetical protein